MTDQVSNEPPPLAELTPPAQTPARGWGAGHSRRGQIDSLRILSVAWVLLDHFGHVSADLRLGRLGVLMFLVISGYLITNILLNSRSAVEKGGATPGFVLRSFWVRRALRIVPGFLLVVGIVYLIDPEGFHGTLLWHLLFQSNIIISLRNSWEPAGLTHLWTLSVQEQFYVIWPLLILFLPRKVIPWALVGIAALDPIYRGGMAWLNLDYTPAAAIMLPAALMAITIGGGAAMMERAGTVPKWFAGPRPYWLIGAFAVYVATHTVFQFSGRMNYLVMEYVWMVPLAGLLLSASAGVEGPVGWFLNLGWVQYLGRISLGVYLYHILALDTVRWLGGLAGYTFENEFLLYGVAPALAVLFAMVSWHVMEKPINSLGRYFPYRPKSAVAGATAPASAAQS